MNKSTMTMEEIKNLKIHLEKCIKVMLEDFENKTDCTIESIELDKIMIVGSNRPQLANVEINMRI